MRGHAPLLTPGGNVDEDFDDDNDDEDEDSDDILDVDEDDFINSAHVAWC